MAEYGPCHKIINGGVDGCGEFEANEDNPKFCEACDCHRSFHKLLQGSSVALQLGASVPGSSAGLMVNSLLSSMPSPRVTSPASPAEELVRRSPRQVTAKRSLNVSASPCNIATSFPGLIKKVKVEPISPTKRNPYIPALAALQKEFDQQGEGRFEFRKEGGAWQIWCCLCKNLNKVGPGPRQLGNFKKHFSSKKHLDMLRSAEDDAAAKELAAEAKVKAKREREESWLATWASEGMFGASSFLFIFNFWNSQPVILKVSSWGNIRCLLS